MPLVLLGKTIMTECLDYCLRHRLKSKVKALSETLGFFVVRATVTGVPVNIV